MTNYLIKTTPATTTARDTEREIYPGHHLNRDTNLNTEKAEAAVLEKDLKTIPLLDISHLTIEDDTPVDVGRGV